MYIIDSNILFWTIISYILNDVDHTVIEFMSYHNLELFYQSFGGGDCMETVDYVVFISLLSKLPYLNQN